MKKTIYILFTALCLLLIACMSASAGKAEDKILARGEGFDVTREFVEAVESYYNQRGFSTSMQEFIKASARIKAFAHDSKRKGYVEQLPSDKSSTGGVARMINIYNHYIHMLQQEYPVSDEVVVSYYRSYPRKFLIDDYYSFDVNQENVSQIITDDLLIPLTEDLKTSIKNKIASTKRREIVREKYEELETEFNIEYMN